MKVLAIGASNGLGKETVLAAAKAGHMVTAFSRKPGRAGFDSSIRLVAGDARNLDDVTSAVTGQDAVIITLGLPTRLAIGPPLAGRTDTLSRGTQNVMTAMQQQGAKRLITETAIGSGDSQRDCTLVARLGLRLGLRWLFKEKDRQELMTEQSGLDWTLIRPSALTNGPTTNQVEVKQHARIGIFTQVSRRDVAAAMVTVLDDRSTFQKKLIVSYPPRFGDTARWLRNYR